MADKKENGTDKAAANIGDTLDYTLDPKLLEILICPVTGGPLDYDKKANELVSKKAGLAYQIREGVPIMLADEAREIG